MGASKKAVGGHARVQKYDNGESGWRKVSSKLAGRMVGPALACL